MEPEIGALEPGQDLRTLLEDYRSWCLRPGAEAGPCRDPRLLGVAARFLRGESDPGAAFSVLRFPEALSDNRDAINTDCRKHLVGFVRAAELLETLSTNLLLWGWRPEVRRIKTYTGPFVYGLLPVLGTSTLQSVLASIGYLPYMDGPHSEFKLCEDADADRAMLLGFELLLARLECQNLLDLQQKDQLGPQEFLQVLHKRFQSTKLMEPLEAKTAVEQKKEEDEEKKKREKLRTKEVSSHSPRPKPRRTCLVNADQSLMEMQKTYPDLTFRGRKLLLDKPHKTHSNTRRSRSVRHTNTEADDGAGGVGGEDTEAAEAVTEELSDPQATSLHIVLRSGHAEEKSLKPEDLQPTSELEAQRKPSLLSSMEEEQDLRGLAERMGQLTVSGGGEEPTRRRSPPPQTHRGEEEEDQEQSHILL
ncbi:unnamed protein product [Ophioblennius macclurei]